jgi:hypothetical protein
VYRSGRVDVVVPPGVVTFGPTDTGGAGVAFELWLVLRRRQGSGAPLPRCSRRS